MKINIFGSTGIIGRKTLEVIDQNFPKKNFPDFSNRSLVVAGPGASYPYYLL